MKSIRFVSTLVISLTLALHPLQSAHADPSAAEIAEQAKYDGLDGVGASGKTVNVIEWEDNLEVHVYPAGSTKSLSLKLDKKNKDKPVMVIGYRFTDNPESQLIRRAILGIPMSEGFKVYKEVGNGEYDKFVITMQPKAKLGGNYAAYTPEKASDQLYPDGHPALAKAESGDDSKPAAQRAQSAGTAAPSKASFARAAAASGKTAPAPAVELAPAARKAEPSSDDDGAIKPFFGQ